MSEEQKPQELVKQYYKIDFAKLAKLIFSDLEVRDTKNILFKTFTKEQVINALQNPQKNEKTLRDVSSFLYILSPHYKRLCNYYAQMLTYDYYVEPYRLDFSQEIDNNKLKKAYFSTLYRLENMNLKHEFQKILEVAFKEGIFYGYLLETNDSFFILKLNPDYCKINSVEDGIYNYSFNFNYFCKDETLLNSYPEEFKKKYEEYKENKVDKNIKRKDIDKYAWKELNAKNSICIKPDETVPYPFAPFVSVLPSVYDLEEYKSLKKNNSIMQNISLIAGGIPYNKDDESQNSFALELGTAIDFGNKIIESLPDQVGFFLHPYEKVELLKLSDDKSQIDVVEQASNAFWRDSGTTSDLFDGSSSTDASQKRAVETDAQICYNILRQIERWLNRKLKYSQESTYKFKVTFLDITHLNKEYFVANEIKAMTFGIPNKMRLCASLGMTPSSVNSMAFLENEILQFGKIFEVPLSANTTSGKDQGRPSEEENNINTED